MAKLSQIKLGNTTYDIGAKWSQYLETWYTDKSKTYGSSYPLYAWWETSSECRLTVDNYTVKVNYADSAGTCTSLSTNAGSTTKAIYFTGGKPAQCNTNIAHNSMGIYGGTKLTSETIDGFLEANVAKWATADATAVGDNDGMVISYGWSSSYGAQMWLDDGSGQASMKIRNRGSGGASWNDWRTILTDYNFNSYAPTLTGGGASGTWDITSDKTNSIKLTLTNPTSSTTYYPVWTSGIGSGTYYAIRGNNGFKYMTLEGTAEALGYGYMILGNSAAEGTAGNKYGVLRLYGTAANYVNLRTNLTGTTNRTVYLRDYGTTSYLVSSTTTSAVGSAKVPTYVNSSGVVKACTMATSGNYFDALTYIASDGVMEVGKYIDFHLTDASTTDNDFRLTCDSTGVLKCSGKLYGAVWNDYAEYRICKDNFKPGQVVSENGDDTLSIANQRLQRGCSIISDTYGFAIGETDEAKCPIAVSGRVLAYGYEPYEEFKKHIGWPVCSGPNGTVSIMTEEEEEKYPSRIIGTISAVPDYEVWGTENIKVNGRIWIKVR